MANQPSSQKTFISLVRAEPHNAGAFQLKGASQLVDGMGMLSHLKHPLTNELIAVPYGSLENYARHLADEWGDDQIYVTLFITTLENGGDSPGTFPDLDAADRHLEQYLNTLPEEKQEKFSRSMTHQPDTSKSDDPSSKADDPSNC
jgi:hypothetical protein